MSNNFPCDWNCDTSTDEVVPSFKYSRETGHISSKNHSNHNFVAQTGDFYKSTKDRVDIKSPKLNFWLHILQHGFHGSLICVKQTEHHRVAESI
jgi:hypothetical protein